MRRRASPRSALPGDRTSSPPPAASPAQGGLGGPRDPRARRAGRLPGLPAELRVDRLAEETGVCRTGSPGRRLERVPAPGRGGLPAREPRLGHDLLLALQPAVRLLPEPRHLAGRRGHAARGRRPRRPDARAAGPEAATTSTSSRPSTSCRRWSRRWREPSSGALRCRSSTTPPRTTLCSSLALLDGLIDVYMPDFKFWEPETAHRLLEAPATTRRARGPRSARCTVRSGRCASRPTGWPAAACWCATS